MTCRFKLAEGEVFSHIGIYKNDKKDNGNHLAYLKGTLEEPEKWLKEDSKYSYELWNLNYLTIFESIQADVKVLTGVGEILAVFRMPQIRKTGQCFADHSFNCCAIHKLGMHFRVEKGLTLSGTLVRARVRVRSCLRRTFIDSI